MSLRLTEVRAVPSSAIPGKFTVVVMLRTRDRAYATIPLTSSPSYSAEMAESYVKYIEEENTKATKEIIRQTLKRAHGRVGPGSTAEETEAWIEKNWEEINKAVGDGS